MKYKVGDKVRVVHLINCKEGTVTYKRLGTTGIITKICPADIFTSWPILVQFKKGKERFAEDELQLSSVGEQLYLL